MFKGTKGEFPNAPDELFHWEHLYILFAIVDLCWEFLRMILNLALVLPMVLKEVDRFIIWGNEKCGKRKDTVIDAEIIE